MRQRDDASVRLWLFSAVAFFGLVILYFLGGRIMDRRAAAGAYHPAVLPPAAPAEPAASPLPTSPVRMKIKRIEPRKYRREGDLPPPPAMR